MRIFWQFWIVLFYLFVIKGLSTAYNSINIELVKANDNDMKIVVDF